MPIIYLNKYRRELKTFQEHWWDEPKTEWIGFYDFEIIRMTIPVKIGIRAVPACLPPPRILNELRDGDILTVSGWGVPKYGEDPPNPPDVLHSADVPFISNERCKEKSYLTRQLHENRALTESMLCAGHVEGGVDACQMDSGGKFKLTLTRWGLSNFFSLSLFKFAYFTFQFEFRSLNIQKKRKSLCSWCCILGNRMWKVRCSRNIFSCFNCPTLD